MKVTSPIGDLPLRVDRLRPTRTGLTVEASMGAWPARIEINVGDIPQLVRPLVGPVTVGMVLAACIAALRASLQSRKDTE
jgi:hypothetical protein